MVTDADLTHRLAGVLERELGKERVVDLGPAMASEDFSRFRENGIPPVMLMIGAVEPDQFAAAEVIGLRELMPPKSRP